MRSAHGPNYDPVLASVNRYADSLGDAECPECGGEVVEMDLGVGCTEADCDFYSEPDFESMVADRY